jgi:hypothetical protein
MSWKTSLFGLLGGIGAAITAAIQAGTLDVSHFPAWFKGAATLLSIVGLTGVGVFARDNNKSSEQVGAGKSNGGSAAVGLLIFVLFTFGATCLMLSGCASERKITYEAVDASYIGVDSAMQAWGQYVAKFHPSAQEEQRVADAYDKYQKASDLAIDGAGTLDAQAALNDLVTLLESLGVTIQARPPPQPGTSH